MSVTDDIKARLDIVSYIGQYVPLKKAGRTHKACCPFHAEKTPSFVVNDEYQSWRCFGACAEGGDIFSFAMKYHGWDFKEALQELGNLAGVQVQQRTPEQKQRAERADYLRGMLTDVAGGYHRKLYDADDTGAAAALAYARDQRGLTDETIKKFGIGYAPGGWRDVLDYLLDIGYSEVDVIEAGLALRSERSGNVYDRFRDRLMVPIRDRKGRVVGFGGRVLNPEDSPKYMNSPQTPVFDKSQLLFGLDVAKQSIRDQGTAVIVEGYMDVITAHQAGFTNVVAQMGTAMTETQLQLVAPRHAERIVLALDSDAAGQNATRRSLEVAREALGSDYMGRLSIDIRVLQIPDAKDPDDLIREEPERWRTLTENATAVADFVIEMEMAGLPPKPTIQQREAVARRVVTLLTATENSLHRQENLQKLAMRLLIPERDLLALAQEVQQEEQRQQEARQRRQQRNQAAQQAEQDEGPPPITDYGAPPPPGEEPPPLDHGQPAPAASTAQHHMPDQLQVEAHLLHHLLQHPDAYYHINRELKDAANGDDRMLKHPMASFGAQDFRHGGLSQLMALFLASKQQDEMDEIDYVFDQAHDALQEEIDLILVNRWDDEMVRSYIGDLPLVRKQLERGGTPANPARDLVTQALRLRCRRIHYEREQLELLQANAESDGDTEQAERYIHELDTLTKAVNRLEMQVNQSARLY